MPPRELTRENATVAVGDVFKAEGPIWGFADSHDEAMLEVTDIVDPEGGEDWGMLVERTPPGYFDGRYLSEMYLPSDTVTDAVVDGRLSPMG